MRALTLICLLWGLCFACPAMTVSAEDGMEGLYAAADPYALDLPEEAADFLDAQNIDSADPQSLLTLSPGAFFSELWETCKQEASAPVRLLGSLLALTLLSAGLTGMGDTFVRSGSVKPVFQLLCVMLCVGTAAEPITECLVRIAETLQESTLFISSFLPVFAAFIAAGGAVSSGAAYQVFVLFLTQSISQLTSYLLFPLLESAIALGILDAVNPNWKLAGWMQSLLKVHAWILVFLMTMFSAMLSIRSFVATAADSLTSKAVKLVSSSLIPIVGSAVSDAYASVQGSILLLRNGLGAVGILALLCLCLPPLISALLYRAVFSIAALFADMTGAQPLARLFTAMQKVLAAAFALLVCCTLMLIFSTAIMLLLLDGS